MSAIANMRGFGSTSGSIMELSKEASAMASVYAPYDLEVSVSSVPKPKTLLIDRTLAWPGHTEPR